MIDLAKDHADPLLDVQSVVPIGLDDTMCDVSVAGHLRASMQEHRGEDGRLSVSATDSMLTHGLSRWYTGGLPRFRLSHGLATKLALTDPDGLDIDEFKFPFPTFLIELPFPNGPLVVDRAEGDAIDDVVTLLVSKYRCSSTKLNERVRASSLAEYMAWCLRMKSQSAWDIHCVHACLIGESVVFHEQRALQSPLSISDHARPHDAAPVIFKRAERAGKLAWRIIFNLALYLKHVDGRATSTSGRTVTTDHGLSSLFYEVGSEVKIDHALIGAARAFCLNGKAHAKWKLDKRFIVRGHWRRQATGAGHEDRRLIFVEPYWKGPPGAPVLARVHTDGP